MGYLGSKAASGAAQAIVAAMPPHDVYIEAFFGSGAVMRAKPRAARSIGLDLDGRVFWHAHNNPLAFDVDGAPGVDLLAVDAIAYLYGFDYAAAGRVLVYADPPYVIATRTSAKRYRCDFTDDDHRRLIECLRSLPCAVILSGYPSALYDELVGDWRQITFQVMTRGGPRTERLWLNFPEGAVAWSTYAGKGFTDRQRIKRKAARWAAMYRALSPGERLAVLGALLAVAD